MLKTVDAEAENVCTNNNGTPRSTIDTLTAGKLVRDEKPMTVELEDVQAIMRTCVSAGQILIVGSQPDFSIQDDVAE